MTKGFKSDILINTVKCHGGCLFDIFSSIYEKIGH